MSDKQDKITSRSQTRAFFLSKAVKLTTKICDGNEEKAFYWLASPNEYFLGKRPIDLIIEGEGQYLINWLEART
jgi:uncharacterized protein (DUF2384 family)